MRSILASAFLAIGLLSSSLANAQVASGTPKGVVQGVTVGIGAYDSGVVGVCMKVFEQLAGGSWQGIGTEVPFCMSTPDFQGSIDNAGGARNYIESVRPLFNARLAARFSSGPVSISGNSVIDQLNTAFANNFQFQVSADGKTITLIPR